MLRKGSVILLALALTGCASFMQTVRPNHLGHTGYIGAQTADVITTRYAIDRGATEANPLLGDNPGTTKLIVWKAGIWYALRAMEVGWERELGRDLHWYERFLFWGPGMVLGILASRINYENTR